MMYLQRLEPVSRQHFSVAKERLAWTREERASLLRLYLHTYGPNFTDK